MKSDTPSTTTTLDEQNIAERIEESHLSAYQMFIIFICFMINVADGFDILAMSYSASALVAD